MVGLTRVSGWVRAVSRGAVARGALLLGACSIAGCIAIGQTSSPDPVPVSDSFAGGFPVGGNGTGGTEMACVPPTVTPATFAAQVVTSQLLFTRELYSWTTDEQAAQLRKDKILFSQSAGTGAPFTFLSRVVSVPGDPLAPGLSSAFQMGRYAWPEPWATRMGWPGQDPGGQLLRILLKPEAWLAVSGPTGVSVFDAQARSVATADALAHLERVGAIYFDTSVDNPAACGGGTGYREFLLGNLAMVQEWSLGTQQIADRVAANVTQLTRFLNNIRSCPNTGDSSTWAMTALCTWGAPQEAIVSSGIGAAGMGGASAGGSGGGGAAGFNAGGFAGTGFDISPNPGGPELSNGMEELAYDQALALPNANYFAAPPQIATIIETLQGDPFQLDPLVVTPGSP